MSRLEGVTKNKTHLFSFFIPAVLLEAYSGGQSTPAVVPSAVPTT
jgi:hypothetical protein